VRVVVVHTSSGAGWVTLVVAIAGVVLSMASIGWQAFSFWRSGHRVRVELRAGAAGPGTLAPARGPKFPTEQVMTALADQGFRRPVLIATIRNVGRQAVTVQDCRWKLSNMTLTLSTTTVGGSFPRRLEAGDQCQAVIELAPILAALYA
jgi:hypothetical protein